MDKRKTKGVNNNAKDKTQSKSSVVQKQILDEIEVLNEREKDKKRTIILILSIFTILIALVGASFAYFTSIVNNIRGNQSFTLSGTELEGLTYKYSDTLSLADAKPGDKVENTFTVTNPNSGARVRYSMKVVADINNFTAEEGMGQLLITVSGGDLKNPVVLDFTDGEAQKELNVFSKMDLSPKESDVFTIKMEFADIGVLQDSNLNKTFVGHIEISQSIVVSE